MNHVNLKLIFKASRIFVIDGPLHFREIHVLRKLDRFFENRITAQHSKILLRNLSVISVIFRSHSVKLFIPVDSLTRDLACALSAIAI